MSFFSLGDDVRAGTLQVQVAPQRDSVSRARVPGTCSDLQNTNTEVNTSTDLSWDHRSPGGHSGKVAPAWLSRRGGGGATPTFVL